jgi:hypothetical protein
VRDRCTAIARPRPIGTAVERVDQRPDRLFILILMDEIRGRGEHAREQETAVDGGQLAQARTAAGVHLQEVIVEAFVPGRVGRRTVRAGPEEAEHRQRALERIGTRHPAARYAHRIRCQCKAHRGDAGDRVLTSGVRDESVHQVGMVQEIVEGAALQRVEPRLSEVRRNRLLLRHQRKVWCHRIDTHPSIDREGRAAVTGTPWGTLYCVTISSTFSAVRHERTTSSSLLRSSQGRLLFRLRSRSH